MSLYRLIAWLLDYPQDNSADVMAAFRQLLNQQVLPAAQYAALQGFIDQYAQTPLLELQARYEGLFDRGRAVSLHLFEHVHGESRDRGQAMVELQAMQLFIAYCEEQLAQGARLNHLTRHILGLYQGQPGARQFRRIISEQAHKPGAGIEVVMCALDALNEVPLTTSNSAQATE